MIYRKSVKHPPFLTVILVTYLCLVTTYPKMKLCRTDAGSFTLQKKFDWLLSFIVGTISPMFYQELDFNGF